MARSRTSVTLALIPFSLVLGMVSGCGQNSRLDGRDLGYNRLSQFQGQEDNEVPATTQNQDFANKLESANISNVDSSGEVEAQVQFENQEPLLFKGKLLESNNVWTGLLSESTGHRPDLTVQASCQNSSCENGQLILQGVSGETAKIKINTEDGVLHQSSLDTPVKFQTIDILPGTKSFSTIYGPSSVPYFSTKNANTKIVGNESGRTIFKYNENKNSTPMTAYYNAKKPYSAPVTPEIPGNCPIHISGQIHPQVAQLIKENCGDSRLSPYINQWKSNGSKGIVNSGGFINFMDLYKNSKTATQPSQENDFRIMLEVLHDYDLPPIWSWTTLIESNFDWRGSSKKSTARGVWQFLKSTARHLGLDPEKRQEIKPSSGAAGFFINNLLSDSRWTGDIRMTLAAYNAGPKAIADATAARGISSRDYWGLCNALKSDKNNRTKYDPQIRKEACPYVSEIISAMLISLDPAAYGMTNIPPMEAK